MGPLLIVDKGRSNGSHRIGTHQKGQFGKSRKIAEKAENRNGSFNSENPGKTWKKPEIATGAETFPGRALWISLAFVKADLPLHPHSI